MVLILMTMLALVTIIGKQGRLFSVIGISIILTFLIFELFHQLSRTNRIVESLLESIRFGDFNKKIEDKASGFGFGSLVDSAQLIIQAIAQAKIDKEIQYHYLQNILEHIHTAVITLDEKNRPEMVNPLAMNILGLYNTRIPSWSAIEKASPQFAKTVIELGESGRRMIRLSNTPNGKQLLVLVNAVKIGGDLVKIITFQDIEPEIDQKEMESWQTLSRIMAHEIMNSLTPLSSLTETGIMLLDEKGKAKEVKELSQQTIDNLYTALKTISNRNQALAQFLGNYRELSRLPLPDKKLLQVSTLLLEMKAFFEPQFEKKGIRFNLVPGSAKHRILADQVQVNQVLINLVKNAMEALEVIPDPVVQIAVKRIFDNIAIEIRDNGPGIPEENLGKIFLPFFSTKSGGSGIGLSLCRQIIRNHGGQITVQSETEKGSIFRLMLPLEGSD